MNEAPTIPRLKHLSQQGVFTLEDANRAGISTTTLYRMVAAGKVIRLERGLYATPKSAPPGSEADFEIACKRFSRGVAIGGLTALYHYGLIDEVPTQIWLLVSPTVRSTDRKYRFLRTTRPLNIGIKATSKFRIVTLERALVDAIVFSSKLGERLAMGAVIRALRRKATSPEKLFSLANELGCISKLEASWQAILAGLGQ
jgi:predicted transcriptional regulator of viral defense system